MNMKAHFVRLATVACSLCMLGALAGCSPAAGASGGGAGQGGTTRSSAGSAARVPEGANVLTASLSHGLNKAESGHVPVMTRSASVIEAIRSRIDALAPMPRGVFNCPADFGQTLTLTFRRSGSGVLAVVRADTSGCMAVRITREGTREAVLRGDLLPYVEEKMNFGPSAS